MEYITYLRSIKWYNLLAERIEERSQSQEEPFADTYNGDNLPRERKIRTEDDLELRELIRRLRDTFRNLKCTSVPLRDVYSSDEESASHKEIEIARKGNAEKGICPIYKESRYNALSNTGSAYDIYLISMKQCNGGELNVVKILSEIFEELNSEGDWESNISDRNFGTKGAREPKDNKKEDVYSVEDEGNDIKILFVPCEEQSAEDVLEVIFNDDISGNKDIHQLQHPSSLQDTENSNDEHVIKIPEDTVGAVDENNNIRKEIDAGQPDEKPIIIIIRSPKAIRKQDTSGHDEQEKGKIPVPSTKCKHTALNVQDEGGMKPIVDEEIITPMEETTVEQWDKIRKANNYERLNKADDEKRSNNALKTKKNDESGIKPNVADERHPGKQPNASQDNGNDFIIILKSPQLIRKRGEEKGNKEMGNKSPFNVADKDTPSKHGDKLERKPIDADEIITSIEETGVEQQGDAKEKTRAKMPENELEKKRAEEKKAEDEAEKANRLHNSKGLEKEIGNPRSDDTEPTEGGKVQFAIDRIEQGDYTYEIIGVEISKEKSDNEAEISENVQLANKYETNASAEIARFDQEVDSDMPSEKKHSEYVIEISDEQIEGGVKEREKKHVLNISDEDTAPTDGDKLTKKIIAEDENIIPVEQTNLKQPSKISREDKPRSEVKMSSEDKPRSEVKSSNKFQRPNEEVKQMDKNSVDKTKKNDVKTKTNEDGWKSNVPNEIFKTVKDNDFIIILKSPRTIREMESDIFCEVDCHTKPDVDDNSVEDDGADMWRTAVNLADEPGQRSAADYEVIKPAIVKKGGSNDKTGDKTLEKEEGKSIRVQGPNENKKELEKKQTNKRCMKHTILERNDKPKIPVFHGKARNITTKTSVSQPQIYGKASQDTSVLQRQIKPEASQDTSVLQRQIKPEASQDTTVLQRQIIPEASQDTSVLQAQIKPEASQDTSVLQRQIKPEASQDTSVLQRQIKPEASQDTTVLQRQIIPEASQDTSVLQAQIKPEASQDTSVLQAQIKPEASQDTSVLQAQIKPEASQNTSVLHPQIKGKVSQDTTVLQEQIKPEETQHTNLMKEESEGETSDVEKTGSHRDVPERNIGNNPIGKPGSKDTPEKGTINGVYVQAAVDRIMKFVEGKLGKVSEYKKVGKYSRFQKTNEDEGELENIFAKSLGINDTEPEVVEDKEDRKPVAGNKIFKPVENSVGQQNEADEIIRVKEEKKRERKKPDEEEKRLKERYADTTKGNNATPKTDIEPERKPVAEEEIISPVKEFVVKDEPQDDGSGYLIMLPTLDIMRRLETSVRCYETEHDTKDEDDSTEVNIVNEENVIIGNEDAKVVVGGDSLLEDNCDDFNVIHESPEIVCKLQDDYTNALFIVKLLGDSTEANFVKTGDVMERTSYTFEKQISKDKFDGQTGIKNDFQIIYKSPEIICKMKECIVDCESDHNPEEVHSPKTKHNNNECCTSFSSEHEEEIDELDSSEDLTIDTKSTDEDDALFYPQHDDDVSIIKKNSFEEDDDDQHYVSLADKRNTVLELREEVRANIDCLNDCIEEFKCTIKDSLSDDEDNVVSKSVVEDELSFLNVANESEENITLCEKCGKLIESNIPDGTYFILLGCLKE